MVIEFNSASAEEMYGKYLETCRAKKQRPLGVGKYLKVINGQLKSIEVDGVLYYLGMQSEYPPEQRKKLIKQFQKYLKYEPKTRTETKAIAQELNIEIKF